MTGSAFSVPNRNQSGLVEPSQSRFWLFELENLPGDPDPLASFNLSVEILAL